jgi:gliding motility-associated lipoprotein GldH
MKYLFFAISLTCLFASCGPDDFFQASQTLPKEGWMYRDTVNFSFKIEDTTSVYRILVDLKYLDTFPNQNLYLKLHTQFPDGKRLSKPYSFDLFNAQGVSNGTCSGHRCLLETTLQENAYFDQQGTYILTFEQFMRHDSIPAITSIGMRLQKTEQKR